MKELKEYIRSIPDFPEKGIIFRDVTSVLQDADALKLSIDELAKRLEGVDFDVIAGAESRGFIFGAPLAYVMHKPFVPIRKKENCRVRQLKKHMIWSMVRQRLKCIKMLLKKEKRLYFWMI